MSPPASKTAQEPLLIALRALKLGDFLTGLPALRALQRAFPEHTTMLLAPNWLEELATFVGATDLFWPHPGLEPLPPALHRADVAVDLHGKGPGSQPLLIEAAPRQLFCFYHPDVPGTEHGATWLPGEHEVARWCRMLAHFGVPADVNDLEIALPPLPPWASGWGPAELANTTVLHPGAASAARRWPLERFAAVGRHEAAQGRPLLITGSSNEHDLVQALADLLAPERPRVLCGTGLVGLAAVLGRCGRAVAGDTGISHLATALALPSVVICGPVGPHLWGPPASRPRHVALWAGKNGDAHGAEVDPGLLEISTNDVVQALSGLDHVGQLCQRRAS